MNALKKIFLVLVIVSIVSMLALPALATDAPAEAAEVTAEAAKEQTDASVKTSKAYAAAICIGLAAFAGAIAMAIAIWKSNESIARQPEAEGSIKSNMMLGLVFIETAIIYALIVGILIIFVL